jgi:HTH-type transcriptional regulator, sugar sensing transcriptional regulator
MQTKTQKHLSALGFSDYEIKAYVTLLAKGPLNGYQLAKTSGIPRPNIYSVLERLTERGAVTEASADGATEFQALPAEEMLNRLSHAFQSDISHAKSALKDLSPAAQSPLAWNLKGYDPLISKAERMIRAARKHILIGLWPQEAGRLNAALADAMRRGVKPTVLCMFGCEQECGGCAGRIYRYPLGRDGSSRRALVLTTDTHQTLIGQVEPDGDAVAAHSTTEVLASLTTQYILNAIAVAEIVRSLGPKMLSIVDAEAMTALRSAGLSVDEASWFDRICGTLKMPQDKKGRKT